MLSIVLCHIQQVYNNKWAWVFNVGVQVFLALSGWLYGNKNINSWSSWCKDKILKLYIPYIIYVIIVFIIYQLFSVDNFSIRNLAIYIFDLQWVCGNVNGLSHLWFMTAIAICYFLTPILQFLKNKGYVSVSLFLLSILGVCNFLYFNILLDKFSCIFIYLFAYLFSCLKSNYKKIYLVTIIIMFVYSLFSLNWDILLDYSDGLNKLFHVLLALLCVLLPIIISNNINVIKVPYCVSLFDKYSYYVYITHHIFVLGPLSLAFCTKYNVLNIGIMLVFSVLSAFLLRFISNLIIKN